MLPLMILRADRLPVYIGVVAFYLQLSCFHTDQRYRVSLAAITVAMNSASVELLAVKV